MYTLVEIRAVVIGFFPCRHVAKVKIRCRQNCQQIYLQIGVKNPVFRDAEHTTIATVLLQFIAIRQYAAM